MKTRRVDSYIREHLRQCLAWLEDGEAPVELRHFARYAVPTALLHLGDEAAMTDVLVVLRHAVDRSDELVLQLVYELPMLLDDGRDGGAAGLPGLGNHALACGALDALLHIARASLMHSMMEDVPTEWLVALVRTESSEHPREILISLIEDWLEDQIQRGEELVGPVRAALYDRPDLYEKLFWPPNVPGIPSRQVVPDQNGSSSSGPNATGATSV